MDAAPPDRIPSPATLRPALREVYDQAGRDAAQHGDLFDGVGRFCLFLGYPRSGHTIIGACLAAHPDVMLAIELDVLRYVEAGFDRDRLFQLLLERARTDKGLTSYEYRYHVEGQWQRRFRTLRVIGDKEGGMSNLRLRWRPDLLDRLATVVGVPVRVVHIVRHPLDNITTMLVRGDADYLQQAIDTYFRFAHNAQDVLRRCAPRDAPAAITVHHETFVARPAEAIASLCEFLGLAIEPAHLDACAAIVFDRPKRSRDAIEWPAAMIEQVADRAREIEFLRQYEIGVPAATGA